MIYDFEPGTNRDFDVIRAGDIFDTENEEIKRLDDEIALMSDKLTGNAEMLNKERDMLQVLTKMMRLQQEKIQMIEEVMHEHRAREMDFSKTDMEFHEKLKALQQQKIQHLKTLQGLAEKHINEMGGRYSKDTNRYNPETEEPGRYLDKSAVEAVLPLKKIKSIKKLKSLLVSTLQYD